MQLGSSLTRGKNAFQDTKVLKSRVSITWWSEKMSFEQWNDGGLKQTQKWKVRKQNVICHMSRDKEWKDITGSKCCSLYLNLTHCSSLRGWVCGGPPCHQLKPREDTTSVIFPTDLSKACFTSSTPSTEPYRLGESQTIQNQWDLKMTRVAKITLKKKLQREKILTNIPH